MPRKKFAHGACFCGQEIVIVGGVSDMMVEMGQRSVPIGDNDCYSFNIYNKTWLRLPDVPIGKLHPTLVVVNSRFVFQIGGFDDFDFDIYRLDMHQPDHPWQTLSLDTSKSSIVDESVYFETNHY